MKNKTIKRCYLCKRELPLSEFRPKSSKTPDRLRSECRECDNKARTKRVIRKKQQRKIEIMAYINQVKSWGCLCCDEMHPCCLDFHHTSDDKESDVSRLIARVDSLVRIKREVAKCVVVCANCHRKIHSNVITLPNVQEKYTYAVDQTA